MPSESVRERSITPEQLCERAGLICIALSGPEMLQHAAIAVRETPFVEFRLDSLPHPAEIFPRLQEFLTGNPQVTAIATCRRKAFGGNFVGSAREQIDLLTKAADAGCLLVDIEVETAEELGPSALDELRQAGAVVIVSWHDFAATPTLDPVYERIALHAPDFIKIVPTALSLRDSLLLLNLLEAHGGSGNLIAMAMGMPGVPTRILGPRFGSAFTFASPDGGEGTAPGQVSATTLRELYRIDSVTPQTAIYGVAGSPIGASLSPRMQNTAFRAAGVDAVYLPLETADAKELHEVVERLNMRGLSITMPLKEQVLSLLTFRDKTVEQMGACNTLLRHAVGKLAGFNTDVAGILDPLERVTSLSGKRVLVLGAGGAARAAVFGLRERGADVFLLNRTTARAEALANEAGAHVQPRETLAATTFDILINSTPYGMRGKTIDPPIEPHEMNCSLFFDLVYNPVETPLVRVARERGIAVIPGVAMFVAQGVRQFSIWTEKVAPEGEMLREVMDALGE
jgi:3-dehydroquinate dehydratase/shikimate dehydrogenase